MVDAAEKIAAGDLDDSLDRIIDALIAFKRPVYFRIGYEFDLPENAYEPGVYKRAFRAVVERCRARGASNVVFVWHSYAGAVGRPHADWYPGDDVVDAVAISYFNQPRALMAPVAAFARAHGKPLLIAEASPWKVDFTDDRRAWSAWFKPFFQFIRDNDVRLASYINCDWDEIPLFRDQGWGDTRLQTNPALLDRWNREVRGKRFLRASPTLFEALGFR
jgi:hypothetical protein